METFLNMLKNAFASFQFTPHITFILVIFLLALYLWFKASKRIDDALDWVDLIIEPTTGKLSTTKLGHLFGIVISSWVIVTLTGIDKLTFDIFGLYLAYVGGTSGWSSYVKAKFNSTEDKTGK